MSDKMKLDGALSPEAVSIASAAIVVSLLDTLVATKALSNADVRAVLRSALNEASAHGNRAGASGASKYIGFLMAEIFPEN